MCKVEIRCDKCGELKDSSQFGNDKNVLGGKKKTCKVCRNKQMQDHRKTKRGRLVQAYQDQRKNSKIRGHIQPMYSLEEFVNYGLNDINFNNLYDMWKAKGFTLWDTPSPDRLDDGLPYSFSNLQFTTFKYNNEKAHKASKDCKYTFNKEVVQLSLLGDYIETYESVVKAMEVHNKGIYDCVSGKTHTCNGYKWEYLRKYLQNTLEEFGDICEVKNPKIIYKNIIFNEDTCLVSIQ